MSPLRVLVVGAGEMGREHAAAVQAAGDHVVAIADENPERARELAGRSGATAYPSLEHALVAEQLDALPLDTVVIATPSTQHLTQSLTALRAGLDVLVEKPHRVPGEDASAVRAALTGRHYAVGMTTRHWPGVEALVDAARSGSLGEILSWVDRIHFRLADDALPGWYFDAKAAGGGVALTNGVHALDRARAALGDLELDLARLTRVFAGHGTEDSAELRLRTRTGAPVDLSLLWAPYEPVATGIAVAGTTGAARVRMDGSWSVVTADGHADGPPVDAGEPFARQWEAFRSRWPGFGLDELEPTLELVEKIYEEPVR